MENIIYTVIKTIPFASFVAVVIEGFSQSSTILF